jgi:hypothetical protein
VAGLVWQAGVAGSGVEGRCGRIWCGRQVWQGLVWQAGVEGSGVAGSGVAGSGVAGRCGRIWCGRQVWQGLVWQAGVEGSGVHFLRHEGIHYLYYRHVQRVQTVGTN